MVDAGSLARAHPTSVATRPPSAAHRSALLSPRTSLDTLGRAEHLGHDSRQRESSVDPHDGHEYQTAQPISSSRRTRTEQLRSSAMDEAPPTARWPSARSMTFGRRNRHTREHAAMAPCPRAGVTNRGPRARGSGRSHPLRRSPSRSAHYSGSTRRPSARSTCDNGILGTSTHSRTLETPQSRRLAAVPEGRSRPFGSQNEQPQRDSNPCLHLERVVS